MNDKTVYVVFRRVSPPFRWKEVRAFDLADEAFDLAEKMERNRQRTRVERRACDNARTVKPCELCIGGAQPVKCYACEARDNARDVKSGGGHAG